MVAENISLLTDFFGYGLIAGFVVSMSKELYDSRSGGSGFDFADLWATIIGVIFGELFYYFFYD